MIPKEILKKIRQIELRTKRLVTETLAGQYHSAFKGQGLHFEEVREYIPGDEIRSIDWNVTARTGRPFIKKYNEERELTVIIMIDVSESVFYGTGSSLKSDIMIELASIISFSAIKNNDKVSLLLFSDQIEIYIPPKKGKSHVLRIIREMIYMKPKNKNTNINIALDHIRNTVKRKSIIFLISDFWSKNFYDSMKFINNKHDLINIQILDPTEEIIPKLGFVKLHDVENSSSIWINTNSQSNRDHIRENIKNRIKLFDQFCKINDIDTIRVNTNQDYIKSLEKYFINRIRRK